MWQSPSIIFMKPSLLGLVLRNLFSLSKEFIRPLFKRKNKGSAPLHAIQAHGVRGAQTLLIKNERM